MTATGCDYYVLDNRDNTEHRWFGVNIFGLFDYLMESGLVLFGRTLPAKRYREILEQALRTEFDED